MMLVLVALFALCHAAYGGIAAAPAVAAPLISAPAPFVAAAAAPVAAPLVAAAAPAPIAYAKAVPQAVLPFASGVNVVARAPLLPYTAVARAPVVSPFVETFSAPLLAPRFAPYTAARYAAAGPYFF